MESLKLIDWSLSKDILEKSYYAWIQECLQKAHYCVKTIQTSSLNGKDQMGWDSLVYYYKVSNLEAYTIFPM
jgi:hypothetical protein